MNDVSLASVHAETQRVYERHASAWDRQRCRNLVERTWLDRFLRRVRPGGHILDVGCGTGEPIARYFIQKGFGLTGLDAAEPMIAIARERFPETTWVVQDIRALAPGQRFDGICGWDSFFHLTRDEQRDVLDAFAGALTPGGALLLTVGPDDGEVLGTVQGEPVYHASLAPEEYRTRLLARGFERIVFVPEDPACLGRSVLLASRR